MRCCRCCPPEIVHLGKKLVGLDQGGGRVTLTFADGARAYADAVVGADGVHSVVREILLGPDAPASQGPRRLSRGLSLGPDERHGHRPSRTKWWGLDRHIVIYYTNADRSEIYFVTSVPEPAEWLTRESWSAKGDVNELRQAYEGFHRRRARRARGLPGLPQVGDPRARAAAALERGPRRAAGRCLPPDDALHGAGRGNLDRGRGGARPLPRRDATARTSRARSGATRRIASRAPRASRRSPAPTRG